MDGQGLRATGAIARLASLPIILAMAMTLATPAQAQYGYSYQPYYNQDAGRAITGSIKGAFSSISRSIHYFFGSSLADRGHGLGRTLGGAGGIAVGSFGGAAIASAVIKGAGLATMGPIAPILVGTAITAGGAFIGAKAMSHGGAWMDRALGPDMTWTLVGATAGAVAGFALLPSLGPFAGPAGRVVGAALGGVVGGLLGKIFAPGLQHYATTKMIYTATGALLGGAGMGIPGALIGAVGGYTLGSIFDNNFFATPGSTLKGDWNANVADYRTPYYTGRNVVNTASWAGRNVLGAAEYGIRYQRTPQEVYAPSTTGTIGTGNPYVVKTSSSSGAAAAAPAAPVSERVDAESEANDELAQLKRNYNKAVQNFQERQTVENKLAVDKANRLYIQKRGEARQ
jgi:hypothetical protein